MQFDRQRLIVLRANRGLTVAELSKLSGVSVPAITRIEAGERTPRPRTLAKLARGLRCEPEALLSLVAA